jgi:predicted phosphatase
MLDIFSARKLRTLNADETLILTGAALNQEIIHFRVAFVFVPLDAIPSQHKMLSYVIDTVTHQAHGDVVPGHTAEIGFVEFIVLPVLDALKVHDTIVIEILAWKYLILYTCWMDVRKRVLVIVPSAKAEIDAANEGNFVVNNHEFFVMGLCN